MNGFFGWLLNPKSTPTEPYHPVTMPAGVTTFGVAFERLIGHEGGYVNHPNDPGGETNWGITLRTARESCYQGNMHDLTREQAKAIYKVAYWDRAQADSYDGAIGAVTLAAVQAMTVTDVLMRFNAARLKFHTDLSTWATFGRGWARRIVGNLNYGADDA